MSFILLITSRKSGLIVLRRDTTVGLIVTFGRGRPFRRGRANLRREKRRVETAPGASRHLPRPRVTLYYTHLHAQRPNNRMSLNRHSSAVVIILDIYLYNIYDETPERGRLILYIKYSILRSLRCRRVIERAYYIF